MKNVCLLCTAAIVLLLSVASCKKDSFITSPNARLRISTDTLKFDTVFTKTGSITQSFKIVNENSQRLLLDHITLAGGNTSPYHININGAATNSLNNIEIAANDSIYVFVSVTVNPTAANLPFIISDSISIAYNTNQRLVQLQAYGQNANFLRANSINSNTTWNSSLPYVILDYLQVAPGATLTINAGTKIYAHADAPFIVDGTLKATGTVNSPIVFSGDRLDEPYKNFPASWPGIFFRQTSLDNALQFVQVKNAYQAISVLGPSLNSNPKLTLDQCIIENAYNTGIYCTNTSVRGTNLLVSNCANNIFIEAGGSYNFTHCTAASFSNNYLSHKTPVLSVANSSSQTPAAASLQASFINCIFWGDKTFIDDEIQVKKQTGAAAFSVILDHCIYRAATDPANTTFTASIKNQDPLFDIIDVAKRYFDFRINNNSAPGVNKGIATAVTKDLENKPRPVGLPDIGCYEKQ